MTEFILALAVVFITAGLLLLVANELNIPPVPTYIVAGLFSGFFIEQAALIELALWGVAFLVFVFGVQVDLSEIESVLQDAESAAFTQLLLVAPIAFVIGFVLTTTFGFEDPFRNALYFSAATTLSSTLVGAQIRQQEIRDNMVYGRLAASIHFADDIVAIGAIVILSADVLTDPQLVTSKIGYGVLFILAGLLLYRHGYPLLARAAGDSDELMLMSSISVLIAFMAAAEAVEISIVVGAFAAGLAVRRGTVQSLGVWNGIESIKDFFAAIFFVTLGALVVIPTVEVVVLAGVIVTLVVLFNPLVHGLAFVREGYDGRTAFLAGTSVNQVSELALVIALQAWLFETIATGLFNAIILAAVVTMILSTSVGPYENRVYDFFMHWFPAERAGYIDEHSSVRGDLTDHVVIVGYGRQSRRLVETFEDIDVPYVVIENDPRMLEDMKYDCRNYIYGDAMATYPMEKARVSEAKLVVSTADYRPVSNALLELETDADLILRADTSEEATTLLDAGATFVAVPGVLASDQLLENVTRVLEDEQAAEELESAHRDFLRMVELAGMERRFERL